MKCVGSQLNVYLKNLVEETLAFSRRFLLIFIFQYMSANTMIINYYVLVRLTLETYIEHFV